MAHLQPAVPTGVAGPGIAGRCSVTDRPLAGTGFGGFVSQIPRSGVDTAEDQSGGGSAGANIITSGEDHRAPTGPDLYGTLSAVDAPPSDLTQFRTFHILANEIAYGRGARRGRTSPTWM